MLAAFYLAYFCKKLIIKTETTKFKRKCRACSAKSDQEYAEAFALSNIASNLAETIKMMEDFCSDDQMCDYYKRNVRVSMQEAREIYGKLIFTRDWIMFKKYSKENKEDAKEPNQEQ